MEKLKLSNKIPDTKPSLRERLVEKELTQTIFTTVT